MSINNMVVYNEEIAGTTVELLGQKINDFVAASGGAFIIDTTMFEGDFSSTSFFNQIAGAMVDIDRYAANNDRAATQLTQSELGGVKVAGGFTAGFEPAQMTYLRKSPDQAIMAIAEGFANALLAKFINQGLAACVAATANIPALVNDVSAGVSGAGALNNVALNVSHSKFGDMSGMLTTVFMTGPAYHKLIEKGLENGERLFVAGNVTVQSILNKLIVVTDSPALLTTGSPDLLNVLSLTAGGIIVDNTADLITNIETTNGKSRIETTWQADFTYGVKLKGYKWDEANGGKSPTSAELATGSNWDKAVAEDKHLAGTLAIADSTQ
jgi:hypothetical protein